MRYTGYVADIELDDDAIELDFEATDYQMADIALVSEDRIRIEWMEGDDSYAVTINGPYEDNHAEHANGKFECSYPSWEGRRNVVQHEAGIITALFIADDVENSIYELERFWIDVAWKTSRDSGRLLFKLEREPH